MPLEIWRSLMSGKRNLEEKVQALPGFLPQLSRGKMEVGVVCLISRNPFPNCFGGGRRLPQPAGGGRAWKAPDVCFFGASAFWFFRTVRATIACAEKGGSHRDSEPLRPPRYEPAG